MTDNPYEAPSANLSGHETYGERSDGVTQGVVEQLRRTKGWTRFIGMLFIILGGGGVLASTSRSIRGLGAMAGIIMVVYGLMGALYLVAGAKLRGFSSAVQRLMYSAQERDLEDALDRQRSFWVFIGVLMLILLVVGIIAVIGAISAFKF